jgi:1-acyl-sn-glycerol-3-phosphate acyltransferase
MAHWLFAIFSPLRHVMREFGLMNAMLFHRAIAAAARLFTGVRRLSAPPHEGDVAIYFANHTSHLDTLVIWSALPAEIRQRTSPAAAEDYWAASALRRWLAREVFQAVLIPRETIHRANNPLDRLAACLEAGRSILIFPEGTRRMDGQVGAFKSGLYHLARRFPEVPLVPVYLDNLSRILPKGTWVPVPIIAQAHFRDPLRWDAAEAKPAFLERARLALLGSN